MPLTPRQEAFLKHWLKKRNAPVNRRNGKPPVRDSKDPNPRDPNPKWSDDAGFEKRYGDPNYYNRIKGLD
jgi:hypothetical protein